MKVRRAIIILILGISVFSNAQAAQIVIDSAASYGEASMTLVTPQEQFQAIDNNFDELYGFWATIDTEAELKSLYNLEDDVDFYTTSTLDTMLLDYVTSSSLTTTLGDYVTASSLTTTLGDYVLTSALTTTLGDYVLTSSLTTTLGDYVLTSALATATVAAAKELTPTKESGVPGYQYLFEADGANELTVGFQGADDLTTSRSYKFPDANGTAGQLLRILSVTTSQTLPNGETGDIVELENASLSESMSFKLGNDTDAISTGVQSTTWVRVPFKHDISSVILWTSGNTGSITIDIWVDEASAGTDGVDSDVTDADSLFDTASEPAIADASADAYVSVSSFDSGEATDVPAGSFYVINVDSAATLTNAYIEITLVRKD